jgi:hypothetical protein
MADAAPRPEYAISSVVLGITPQAFVGLIELAVHQPVVSRPTIIA